MASADLQVCTSGATAGKCADPRGLATDFEAGLLYVADSGNSRIDIFRNGGTEPGTPPSLGGVSAPLSIAVDNDAASASHHDLYAVQGFKVKKLEPNGTVADEFGEQGDGSPEGCELERENDPVAVGPGGDVYLADSYLKEKSGGKDITANRVVKFDDEGNCIGAVPLFQGELPEGQLMVIRSLAVDSAGAIYVTDSTNGLSQYDGVGSLVKQFEALQTVGLGVDPEDHLFVLQLGERATKLETNHFLTEYDSAANGNAILRRFAYAPGGISGSPSLAALHTADGDVFVSEPSGVRYVKFPEAGPVLFPEACHVKGNAPGSVRATLQAEVNPEGKATTFQFEYEALGGSGAPFENAVTSPPVSLASGATDFELHEAAQSVEPLEPESEYRCRIIAKNADSPPAGTIGEEGTFETREPFTFGPAWSSLVNETSATVNAEGNPNGAPWTAQIEYITDAAYQANGGTFAGALKAPTPPLDYGSSEGSMVLRSAQLSGLAPGTLYHYRLRAFNEGFPGGLVCPEEDVKQGSCPALEHTFRTYSPAEAKPDNRGYELVSPGLKNSAEVGERSHGRGVSESNAVLIQAGAASGEAVTYPAWISFGEAAAAPGASQYVSKRTPTGWSTANASPFGFQPKPEVPPYLGFSPELGFGTVKSGETPIAPGCPAGVENLYLYEAASGSFRCLTTEAPQTANKFGYCFIDGGTSEDGSRAFFKASVRYANAPPGNGFNLYEAHEGQIKLISVLPGQTEPVPATPKTTFGAKTGEGCQTGQSILHNAISADGSKAIWTYVPTSGPSQLLDRIEGSETVQIDKTQSGSGTSGEGTFWAASDDGTVVYFTSPNRLISGVKAELGAEDLYRYDFSKPLSPKPERLQDLTVKGSAPGAVKGVIGSSEDGSVVYYVAGSALTPESETNQAGQHAEAAKNNLYVYDATEGKNHFIAQLSGEDNLDWETQPKSLTARVSADGQSLAFLSSQAEVLADFDNTLAASKGKFEGGLHCRLTQEENLEGSPACPEAFLYSKSTASLTCASCNPAGSRPLGPALLPGWTSMSEGPRYLSAAGNRLFFETYDRLLASDENNLRDVYEFERSGTGTCSASSPNFDPLSGGCHFLVSNGRSSDESFLIDASTTGRDVFFSTRSALTGWDVNENYDVYDYREGGGFAEPVAAEVCEGEGGCVPPGTIPPTATGPATPSFNGPGNPKPKPAKHKKKKQKHHKKKHKAAKKRSAAR